MESGSKALDYQTWYKSRDAEELIQSELSKTRLRRLNIIANNLARTIDHLENGEWKEFIELLKNLVKRTSKDKERRQPSILQKSSDLCQKQSRNFIQWVAFSRHEEPIDSRVTLKMKQLVCSFVPSSTTLCDEAANCMVQDGLELIAEQLGTEPCIFFRVTMQKRLEHG